MLFLEFHCCCIFDILFGSLGIQSVIPICSVLLVVAFAIL